VFLITAVFPLLLILSAILLDENKFSSKDKIPIYGINTHEEFGKESNQNMAIF
jgi:hypothetical protein